MNPLMSALKEVTAMEQRPHSIGFTDSHPIHAVRRLVTRMGLSKPDWDQTQFSMSCYCRHGASDGVVGSKFDHYGNHIVFSFGADTLFDDNAMLQLMVSYGNSRSDYALHGQFFVGEQELFVPVVDLLSTEIPDTDTVFGIVQSSPAHLYSTGRSFHLYGLNAMCGEEVQKFWGRCLLSDVSDYRWLGHAMDSVPRVRWTAVDPEYLKVPEFVQEYSREAPACE